MDKSVLKLRFDEAAEKFEVKGYLRLKFSRGGKTTDAEYEGNRTAGAIVSWLEKKTTPRTKTLETLEAARESLWRD